MLELSLPKTANPADAMNTSASAAFLSKAVLDGAPFTEQDVCWQIAVLLAALPLKKSPFQADTVEATRGLIERGAAVCRGFPEARLCKTFIDMAATGVSLRAFALFFEAQMEAMKLPTAQHQALLLEHTIVLQR